MIELLNRLFVSLRSNNRLTCRICCDDPEASDEPLKLLTQEEVDQDPAPELLKV